jgi:hypothetical protein
MSFFGLFKKKQGPPQELETFDINLEDLEEWFESEMKTELAEKKREAEKRYENILDSFSEIRANLNVLDQARLSSPERLHISANMIKESFVKKSTFPLNTFSSFYTDNFKPEYDYFLNFQDKGMEAVKALKAATPKQTILLSRYFKRESTQLVESIKKAENMLTDFKEFLRAGSGPMETLKRVRTMMGEHVELVREYRDVEKRSDSLLSEASGQKERKSELEKKYLKLLKSREWNQVNKLSEEVKKTKERMSDSEARLGTELSSVKRPVKKLEHELSRSGKLTPIQKNSIQDFIRNPMKTIMNSKGEAGLIRSLKQAKKQLDAGKIKIKAGDEIDAGEVIDRLEGDVQSMKGKYIELMDTLESKQEELKKLSDLKNSKGSMESEIQRMSEDLGKVEEEIRDLKNRKATITEKKKAKIRDIEIVIIEEAQKKVNIRV